MNVSGHPSDHSSSGSSSRSDSPDTWRPPGGLPTNKDIIEIDESVDSNSMSRQGDSHQKVDDEIGHDEQSQAIGNFVLYNCKNV